MSGNIEQIEFCADFRMNFSSIYLSICVSLSISIVHQCWHFSFCILRLIWNVEKNAIHHVLANDQFNALDFTAYQIDGKGLPHPFSG